VQARRAAAARRIVVPSETEVQQMIDHLDEILVVAANDSTPGIAEEVRQFMDCFTGGRIDLVQMGERRPRKGWLRGQFECSEISAVIRSLTGVEIMSPSDRTQVVIDFTPEAEDEAEANDLAEQVKALYDEGALVSEIARRLKRPRSAVSRALDRWFDSRGLERPDGRSRRASLAVKHLLPPRYQEIADRTKELADSGLLFDEIARELDVDRNTVTAGWVHWHTVRGLTAPDGRTRRKTLPRKSADLKNGS
jgi:transposase-like protein